MKNVWHLEQTCHGCGKGQSVDMNNLTGVFRSNNPLHTACVQAAGYSGKVKIGMDVAASEFLTEDGKYDLNFKNQPNDGSEKKTGCVFWSVRSPIWFTNSSMVPGFDSAVWTVIALHCMPAHSCRATGSKPQA